MSTEQLTQTQSAHSDDKVTASNIHAQLAKIQHNINASVINSVEDTAIYDEIKQTMKKCKIENVSITFETHITDDGHCESTWVTVKISNGEQEIRVNSNPHPISAKNENETHISAVNRSTNASKIDALANLFLMPNPTPPF